MSDPSNAAEGSHIDVEQGESSHESVTNKLSGQHEHEMVSFASKEEEEEEEAISYKKKKKKKKKSILERWAKTFVMVSYNIAINIFITLWACNGVTSPAAAAATFHLHMFVLIVMVNFYASVAGIILWHFFPVVARGFHAIAFFCTLLSLTILFGALLPDDINSLPWILLALVVSMVLGLVAYQNC
ncbi:hypothetical protein ACOSQ3_028890 [Xanthoceras sorbifolium]